MRAIAVVIALVASLVLVAPPNSSADDGQVIAAGFSTALPASGVALMTWDGGSVEKIAADHPRVIAVWVTISGEFLGYIVGAPSFVNTGFLALYPGGQVTAGTVMIVVVSDAWAPPLTIQQPVVASVSTGTVYDRDDWDHWTDADSDCQDTRAEVLIAESTTMVTFTAASGGCTVLTGSWKGPFTGQSFTQASDVDVDHMVPLKNAHDAGGWAWSPAKKQEYANDQSDPQHLIAVDDGTNQSKGARGPDHWMPPLQSYWCHYAVDWIGIKNTWGLTVNVAEWSALLAMLDTCSGGAPAVLP